MTTETPGLGRSQAVGTSGRAAALALVAMLVAVGCGSASSKVGAAPGGQQPSGAPIVIGNIGDYSGPQSASIIGAKYVIGAWVATVNARGGLRGRPVKVITEDGGENATTALVAIKTLIDTDHVVAIVNDENGDDVQWAPIAEKAGVPVIGGLSIDLPFLVNPDFFPQGTNVVAASYALEENAKAIGPKMALLYCAEAPQCAEAVPLYRAIAKSTGIDIVYTAPVSATAPDYTAVCQALKNSGASSYQIGDGGPVIARIATACQQQGVTAVQVTDDGTVTSSWLTTPALDGAVSAETDFPWTDRSLPATKAYQDAIEKYAPSLGAANGPSASYAWVSAKIFEKAVDAIPAGQPVSAASVRTALYTFTNETVGGLAPPLTYRPGVPAVSDCWFDIKISRGAVTEPSGLSPRCAPAAVVQAITAGLHG